MGLLPLQKKHLWWVNTLECSQWRAAVDLVHPGHLHLVHLVVEVEVAVLMQQRRLSCDNRSCTIQDDQTQGCSNVRVDELFRNLFAASQFH